jgi:hypothetical protein
MGVRGQKTLRKKRKASNLPQHVKENHREIYSDIAPGEVEHVNINPVYSPEEVRKEMYKVFEVHGFVIVNEAYLYAFVRYYDSKGKERAELRQFVGLIEFMPYELRVEFYEAISDFIHHEYASNIHLMPTDEKELKKHIPWKVKSIRVLRKSEE